ncbi:MAG: ribonuclease P protein component [Gammaproteobacteria bacterium]|nr:MAG: ribonuclease P protein component [Gammaproteobacteria bacterium]
MPPTARLRRAADYSRVFSRGRAAGDRHWLVLAADNGLPHARLGLAISRKVLRRAWQRNLVKRIARESFRRHKHLLKGLDVVVLARAGCRDAARGLLRSSLDELWHRIAATTDNNRNHG